MIKRVGFRPASSSLWSEMERAHDERVKQVAIGVSILILLAVTVTGLLLGWRLMPGLLGEWLGTIIGIMTTPFFLEASFAIIGLITVITLNHWRQVKDGDEFVYLEQVTGPDVPENLPENAKWAVYRQKPLDAGDPPLLVQAEGAFSIGDYPMAAEKIGEMTRDELMHPATLDLRLALAKATGRHDLIAQLETEIREAGVTKH